MLLIGTDEAGYGPNLGPLVIAATAWQIDECFEADAADLDLYRLLGRRVSRRWESAAVERQVAVADSKKLYSSGNGLRALELGVGAALSQLGVTLCDFRGLWEKLTGDATGCFDRKIGHRDFDRPLPLAAEAELLACQSRLLQAALADAGVRLLACRVAAVFPAEFNDRVDFFGSKGELLSQATLGLARQTLTEIDLPPQPALIHCDKHGGRNRYAPLLQSLFPDHWIEVVEEGRQLSRYRIAASDRRLEFRFAARGESFLPSALASMLAKYLRELAMLAFNDFWRRHLPSLRPTAGYPLDARRFHAEIREVQIRLGIADRVLWRNR